MSGWEAMQQGAPDPFFGYATGGIIKVKTCKRRRHQYYGATRCIACKRDYDRRYQAEKRAAKKRYKERMMWLMSERLPQSRLVAADAFLRNTVP